MYVAYYSIVYHSLFTVEVQRGPQGTRLVIEAGQSGQGRRVADKEQRRVREIIWNFKQAKITKHV